MNSEDFNGKDYAVTNLKTVAQNVTAYASYAREAINDPYGELYTQIEKAEKAVRRLASWINRH